MQKKFHGSETAIALDHHIPVAFLRNDQRFVGQESARGNGQHELLHVHHFPQYADNLDLRRSARQVELGKPGVADVELQPGNIHPFNRFGVHLALRCARGNELRSGVSDQSDATISRHAHRRVVEGHRIAAKFDGRVRRRTRGHCWLRRTGRSARTTLRGWSGGSRCEDTGGAARVRADIGHLPKARQPA